MFTSLTLTRTVAAGEGPALVTFWTAIPFVSYACSYKGFGVTDTELSLEITIRRPADKAWQARLTRLFMDMTFELDKFEAAAAKLVDLTEEWEKSLPTLSADAETAVTLIAGVASVLAIGFIVSSSYSAGKKAGINSATQADFDRASSEGYIFGLSTAKADVWNDGYLSGAGVYPMGPVGLDQVRSRAFEDLRVGGSLAQRI